MNYPPQYTWLWWTLAACWWSVRICALLLLCLSVLVSPPTTSALLLVEEMHGGSALPPTRSQADDSPLLRSLSPILPLSQASPGMGQEGSLANVFVPLDAIKPSELQDKCFKLVCFMCKKIVGDVFPITPIRDERFYWESRTLAD